MLKLHRLWPGLSVCALWLPVTLADLPPAPDPSLSRWVADVLAENPRVQAARSALDAARSRAEAAGQPLFNPELEFEYEDAEVVTTSGGIGQTLDWTNKRAARATVANFELQVVTEELRATRQALAFELLSALADYRTADSLARVAGSRFDLMKQFGELAERRRTAGDLSQIEQDLATLAFAEAQFQFANATTEAIAARQGLTALTGSLSGSIPPFPKLPPAFDLRGLDHEALLDELPAMRVARAKMDVARSAVELRIRETRPDPTFGIRVGKEGSDTLAGFSVSIPLFVRNTFRAEVDVANAESIRVESEARNLRRRARAELESSARAYDVSRNAWLAWEESGKTSLGRHTALLERLWQAGELSTTDYLVQLKQTMDTEAGAIEQRGRMWQAWNDWLEASGQIEQWLKIGEVER